MFRNVKIVVWALSLTLLAVTPHQVAASCTGGYLTCLNDGYQFGGGAAGAMSDVECGAEWFGCAVSALKFW
jgi:hypothetical protein